MNEYYYNFVKINEMKTLKNFPIKYKISQRHQLPQLAPYWERLSLKPLWFVRTQADEIEFKLDQLIDLMLDNQRDVRQIAQRLAGPQQSTQSSPEASSDASVPHERAITIGEAAGVSTNLCSVIYSHSEANLRAMQAERRSAPPRALGISSADGTPTRGRSQSLVPSGTPDTVSTAREEAPSTQQWRVRKRSNPPPCSILINDTPIHELTPADHSSNIIPGPGGSAPGGPLVPPRRPSFTKNPNARNNLSKSSSVYALCNRPQKKSAAGPRSGSLSDLLTASDESQPPIVAEVSVGESETPSPSTKPVPAATVCVVSVPVSSASSSTPPGESATKQGSRAQYYSRQRKGRLASERTASIETTDSWPSVKHCRLGTTSSTRSDTSSSTHAIAARAAAASKSSPPDSSILKAKKHVTIASPGASSNRDPLGSGSETK